MTDIAWILHGSRNIHATHVIAGVIPDTEGQRKGRIDLPTVSSPVPTKIIAG